VDFFLWCEFKGGKTISPKTFLSGNGFD